MTSREEGGKQAIGTPGKKVKCLGEQQRGRGSENGERIKIYCVKSVRFLNGKYNKRTPFVNESVRDKGTLCLKM